MYVDVDSCVRRGILGKVSVSIDGVKINGAVAAKHGKNGFVEYFDEPPKLNASRDGLVTQKRRGNVKVSFNLGFN